jgi:hypothetical protein
MADTQQVQKNKWYTEYNNKDKVVVRLYTENAPTHDSQVISTYLLS